MAIDMVKTRLEACKKHVRKEVNLLSLTIILYETLKSLFEYYNISEQSRKDFRKPRHYTEKFEMTQRVELADKVCPCGAMSTGAYQPNDAT